MTTTEPNVDSLDTAHGRITLPAFLPDATRAVVRAVDCADLKTCGVEALVVSQFHLRNAPGTSVVERLGGVHAFMGWDGPVLSDSGGFQIFSLLKENREYGSVTKKGFRYRTADGGKKLLTPEKAIRSQFGLGADVIVCLDHCTHPDALDEEQQTSVANTVLWATESKRVFDQILTSQERRPRLFAVIQGGSSRELRTECAQRLLEIGFDGFGFGGWPIDKQGQLVESVQMVAELIPRQYPLWGLGIGKPEHVLAACRMGYTLLDCVLPTRDGRHGRLYVFRECYPPDFCTDGWYEYVQIMNDKHSRSPEPVDSKCDCLGCRRYSRAYLHHLFRVHDPLAFRLATIHNLKFYSNLMAAIRQQKAIGGEAAE